MLTTHMAISIEGARARLKDPSTRRGVVSVFGVSTSKEVRAILDEATERGFEVIPADTCTYHDSTGRCQGHPSTLPMSLRTARSEEEYFRAKQGGKLKHLYDEPTLVDFKHWRIIANNFPYDAAYSTSHMLVPRRILGTYDRLNWRERREMRKIIDTYCQDNYHQVVENMTSKRSVLALYHIHLLRFVDSREEFQL